jgi:3-phosphoshikimate 1-carboxyvinyltransferase
VRSGRYTGIELISGDDMIELKRSRRVRGTVHVPGDKSLSHRMLVFGALALGITEADNLAPGEDVQATLRALKQLGIGFDRRGSTLLIGGQNGEFREASGPIDCGNSGTTARMLLGALASQKFATVLCGDESLCRRPMGRVTVPLQKMGAWLWGADGTDRLPLAVCGGRLEGVRHNLDVSSAQVKTALLLAGLRAEGLTSVTEPEKSRDHSERILRFMGADIKESGNCVKVRPGTLKAVAFDIPGDFSSAAFFVALAVLHPNAEIELRSVNLNPTRMGFVEVLAGMGADVAVSIEHTEPEPVGTIWAKSSELKGVRVVRGAVPRMIDELPLLALCAAFAKGKTVVRGAQELRVKESDRIRATRAEARDARRVR